MADPRALPIYEIESVLIDALRTQGRAIVQAPTGSGKSTQVPQMLDRAGMLCSGQAVILQPRRLAARMLARRVASEMNVALGADVGYQVRLESRQSEATRIRFVTEGILLRQMIADPSLRGVSALIFDEFHERHLYGDVTLGRALQLQQSTRPDLRIVVMSATLNAAVLKSYLEPCAEIVSEGRTFPVEIRHLNKQPDPKQTPIWELAAAETAALIERSPEGHALVFMPGAFEISRTVDALRARFGTRDVDILPLHGELATEDQDRAVSESAKRRVIVSTNVAETSLTIPGVRVVIDSGLARIARYDPHRGIDTLLVEKISQASADQRSGRAGRTGPGICLRLWTERDHAHRAVAELPEVRRLDLAEVILTLKASGIGDLRGFPWVESPGEPAIQTAETLLQDLGALDVRSGAITDLGRRVLHFPAHPRYGRMLVEADRFGCVQAVACITALTQGRPILLKATSRSMEEARDDELGEESESDLFRLLAAFSFAQANRYSVDACRRLGIHAQSAQQAARVAAQFLDLAKNAGMDTSARPIDRQSVKRCILAGFADRVARRLDSGTLRCAGVHGRRGVLARESVCQRAQLLVAAEINEIGGRGNDVTTLFSLCTAIDEELLADVFPGELLVDETVALDPQTKRVSSRRKKVFRDLVLEDRESGEPSPQAAAELLVREIVEGRCKLPQWDETVDQWIWRLNLMARLFPEFDVAPLTEQDRPLIYEQLCEGARSHKDVRNRPLLPVLKSWLTAEQLAALDQLFPERYPMPGGRRARIRYSPDGTATLSARIQDFYDMDKHPAIASGRLRLRIEFLAPNQRPVQITDDLQRFWTDSYPAIRTQLAGRYPKHEWR